MTIKFSSPLLATLEVEYSTTDILSRITVVISQQLLNSGFTAEPLLQPFQGESRGSLHNPINSQWGAQWYSPRDGEERLFAQASKSVYTIREDSADLLVQITELRASVIASNLQKVIEEYKALQKKLEQIAVSGDRTIYFN